MRIKSKKEIVLETPIPVYDIEVPETSNFTLSSGVIVHNSKDISDGLAGALYNASMHESEFTFHLTEDAGTIMDANSGSNVQNDREDLLNKLVASTVSNAMKDRNIIDVIPETSPGKDTDISDKINNIQNNNPGMSLGDAMKEYIKEQHSSQPSDPNDPDEIKKRFMAAKARQSGSSSDINDRIQDMMDDKDGIILF